MAKREMLRINLVGDVMLGRLIDQCFPTHVNEPEEARVAQSFKSRHPEVKQYDWQSPWGNTLHLFNESDLNLINLETSVTASSKKWPDKVFNHRMHPDNIQALHAARVSYASLANNHTLDFSEQGLRDTVAALTDAKIPFAGVGLTKEDAHAPAILTLTAEAPTDQDCHVYVWSASDHPSDWSRVPGFHLIDYSAQTKARLKQLIQSTSASQPSKPPSLKIFSVHWGPNYAWRPAEEIKSLAHYLIDECGIDLVHGHSSHHVQGVERYNGRLIIYGCGDFVDDYALVPEYRNDLSAVWRVNLLRQERNIKLATLEVFPTRIRQFQAQQLSKDDPDHEWTKKKLVQLSAELGFNFSRKLGDQGQLIGNS